MDELRVPSLIASQVAYHLRVATAFAAAGDASRAASEIALAWTVLFGHGWVDSALVAHDLPSPQETAGLDWDAVARRTEALALALQSHFVSEGQYETAAIYESAATSVRDTIATLRP
jgi:hypothetical protein